MTIDPVPAARHMKCDDCVIHHRALCRNAGPDAIAELNRISHLRSFSRGQNIQGQGEEAAIVGNVVSGVVRLSSASIDGSQHIVGLLFASDFFGRVFAETSRFSYEAATDVTVCCMKRLAFERFLADHPEAEHELLIVKLDELDAVREWNSIISGHTTMQRVATFLYVLAKRTRNQGCGNAVPVDNIIHIPISRRDIAAYLGTTPETLSRNIQAMARKKVFRIIDAKHFELLDEAALIRHAGEARGDLENMVSLGG